MSKLILTLICTALIGVFIVGCGQKQSTEVVQPNAASSTKTDMGRGDDGSGKSTGGVIGDFEIDR